MTSQMPIFGYLSDLGECVGGHALTEIRRFQMAEKPPSTHNSNPFTKLESSEARNNTEIERVRRVSDMLLTGHANLRDRYRRWATLLDLAIMALSTWLSA